MCLLPPGERQEGRSLDAVLHPTGSLARANTRTSVLSKEKRSDEKVLPGRRSRHGGISAPADRRSRRYRWARVRRLACRGERGGWKRKSARAGKLSARV